MLGKIGGKKCLKKYPTVNEHYMRRIRQRERERERERERDTNMFFYIEIKKKNLVLI